ncbi:MAG: hypothetical protein ACK5Q5_03460 [Planctomycetaceae bacterium]
MRHDQSNLVWFYSRKLNQFPPINRRQNAKHRPSARTSAAPGASSGEAVGHPQTTQQRNHIHCHRDVPPNAAAVH